MTVTGKPDAHRLDRNPAFLGLIGLRAMGVAGHQLIGVAIGWQIWQATRDPLALGLIGLAQFLPALVFAPLSGMLADRIERRRLLLTSSCGALAAAMLLLAMTLTTLPAGWLLAGTAMLGAARSFGATVQQAMLPGTVPRTQLSRALAVNATITRLAMIGSPAAAGGLLLLGVATAYITAAALFAGAFILGLLLPVMPRITTDAPPPSAWALMTEGLRFIASRRLLTGAMTLDLFAVLLGGASALLPIYASEILHVGPAGFGLLRSAPSIGSVAAAILLARWPITRGAGLAMLGSVAAYGAATIVFGLVQDVAVAVAMLILTGATDMTSTIIRQTVVQLATPDRVRGRVSSISSIFVNASNFLGQFETGLMAAALGPVGAVVTGGVGAMVVAVLWAWRFPELRRIDLSASGPAESRASVEMASSQRPL